MNKSNKNEEACIQRLYDFRSNIPANLSKDKIKSVWGIDKKYPQVIEVNKDLLNNKLSIAKKSLEWLACNPFVKFIGVSGSVASEFVQSEDDVDLFIVTQNDTAWIYRLYIYFKNIFHKKIRSKENVNKGGKVKDKLCVNFITEQRALTLDSDIFNLNELIYLKPIYNTHFQKVIFLMNPWLQDKYLVSSNFLSKESLKVEDVKNINKRNYLLSIINFLSFAGQLLFMVIMRHKPDIKRLWNGFKRGRIEFYPKNFKKEKIKKFISH